MISHAEVQSQHPEDLGSSVSTVVYLPYQELHAGFCDKLVTGRFFLLVTNDPSQLKRCMSLL